MVRKVRELVPARLRAAVPVFRQRRLEIATTELREQMLIADWLRRNRNKAL
jgi:hypothetical protein